MKRLHALDGGLGAVVAPRAGAWIETQVGRNQKKER